MHTIVQNDNIQFNLEDWPTLQVSFIRTLRIPDDGRIHRLPAGLGLFPIKRIEDYKSRVPESWAKSGGVFFPMYQREALWLRFRLVGSKLPWALKIAAGKICAVSGRPWTNNLERLDDAQPSQNYVVLPEQPWLDGFNSGDSQIRQFIAEPLGSGYTVEGQITGKEEFGGIQLQAFAPKTKERRELLEEAKKAVQYRSIRGGLSSVLRGTQGQMISASSTIASTMEINRERSINEVSEMGLAQGGRINQQIFSDPHPLSFWNTSDSVRTYVHIVNSESYKYITGEDPPPSPITEQSYKAHGMPWFDFYQEKPSIPASPALSATKSVADIDHEKTVSSAVSIPSHPNLVKDGEW